MQVAGQVEKESKATVNTANALIFGTKWTGKINTDNAWSKACTKYPEILQPRKLKDSEDGQVNWLPYKNINDWTDRVKDHLIDMNMVKYESGWISNTYFLVYFFTIYKFKISHCFLLQMMYDLRCHSIILVMPVILLTWTKHNTGSQHPTKKEDQLLNAMEVHSSPVQESMLLKVCAILLTCTQPIQQRRLFLFCISSTLSKRKNIKLKLIFIG